MSNLNEMKKLWQVVESADLNQEVVKEEIQNPLLTNGMTYDQLAEELAEFRETTKAKIKKFEKLLRPTHYYGAAKAYWMGHILSALGDPDYYTHTTTVEKTINQIEDDIQHDGSEFDEDGYDREGILHKPVTSPAISLDDTISQGDWEPESDIYTKG
jgi:hypothetical protein